MFSKSSWKCFPQRLKPSSFFMHYGTAEAVPFQNRKFFSSFLREKFLDLLFDHILGNEADDLIGHLAALEEEKRGNAADAVA